MADSFIIYTPNPPSISTLTSSGKQSEWTKITKNLEKILEDYKKNDLANQEMLLFEIFIDKPFKEMNCLQFYKVVRRIMEKINYEIKDNNFVKTN
jgi:esterase/lipase